MSSEDQAQAFARMMLEWNDLKRETAAIEIELMNRARAARRFADWLVLPGDELAPHLDPAWTSADAATALKRELAEKRAEMARMSELLRPMGWQEPR